MMVETVKINLPTPPTAYYSYIPNETHTPLKSAPVFSSAAKSFSHHHTPLRTMQENKASASKADLSRTSPSKVSPMKKSEFNRRFGGDTESISASESARNTKVTPVKSSEMARRFGI